METGGLDWLNWGTALGLGLLIGAERERSQPDDAMPAGLRSFALTALAGAVAERFGSVALVAVLVVVGALSLAGYRRTRESDPGLTTELALLLTLLLGALAMRAPGLAAALAVVTAVLLAAKEFLHGFVRRILSEDELHHGLMLAGAVLVVLPLLPDRGLPWLSGLNPHLLWLLAVLLMGVQTAAHVGLRVLGPTRGLLLAGLLGGFVSSVATIGAMGQRARSQPELFAVCVAAANASNVATVIELGGIVTLVAPRLLGLIVPALGACALVALGGARLALVGAGRGGGASTLNLPNQPFSARAALLFAFLVGVFLLVASLARTRLGAPGLIGASALGGFADAHASSASAAQLFADGAADARTATLAIGAAFSANACSKAVAAFFSGKVRFGWRILAVQVALIAAFWGGAMLGASLGWSA